MDDEDSENASAFVDRLRSAMADMSQAVVAKRSRISTSAFSKLLQGAEPGLFKAARIARTTGVNLDWLATGQGNPNAAKAGYLEVPILDVRLAAGAASLSDASQQIGAMPFDHGLLRSLGRSSGEGLVVLTAEGDSMEPLIADGARVLADTTDTRLREGIFAFRIGDELRVKRLRRRGSEAVEVLSENPRYDPELLEGHDLDQFAILGRVLWAATSI
ncbi:MAG: hypothetical protein DCF29_09400 [Alphaproteobacteria bacterium]|nr:MAG: hypothetical protein DCF29_09400 [Alphaproteobacteria bacterium]